VGSFVCYLLGKWNAEVKSKVVAIEEKMAVMIKNNSGTESLWNLALMRAPQIVLLKFNNFCTLLEILYPVDEEHKITGHYTYSILAF